jgi:hypothetical protein
LAGGAALAASADDKVLHLKVFMAPLAAFSISIPLKTSMWRPAKTEKASTRAVPTRYPHPLKQKLKAGRSIGLTKPTSMGSCIVNPFHSLGSNRPAEDLQLRNDEKGDKSAATRTKQGTFRQRKFSATLHFKVPKGFPPAPDRTPHHNQITRREVAYQRIKSLKPLYYEGQPMAMEWAQKAIKDLEYTRKWFSCLGEGIVTVF